jgi:hypothetical protein
MAAGKNGRNGIHMKGSFDYLCKIMVGRHKCKIKVEELPAVTQIEGKVINFRYKIKWMKNICRNDGLKAE